MIPQKIRLVSWLGGIGLLIPLVPWLTLKTGLSGPPVVWIHELLMLVCPPALILLFIPFFEVSSFLVVSFVNSLLYACVGTIATRLVSKPTAYFAFLGLILVSLRLVTGICVVLLAGTIMEPANVSIKECAASFASPSFLVVGALITVAFAVGRSRYLSATIHGISGSDRMT